MADHSSLPAGQRLKQTTENSRLIDWKLHGRFWSRVGLSRPTNEAADFSTGSVSTLAVSDTTMSATKELPHPASPKPLVAFPTSSEYAEKVLGRFHHHHNISDSTAASNDSSPTTTCSTIDDSSATEASPGSSPESPPPNSFAAGMFRPRTAHEQSAPFFELQKAAPPKKGRNLKNLAVNTSRTPGRASSTTSLPLAQKPEPEPSIMSPSFVKPPSPPKRKPSSLGLTIQTPASINAQPQQIKLAIPATPSFGRPGTLRHFQSSPSLPLFPSLGEEQTIAPRPFQTTTLETIFSPTEGPQVQAKVDEEQNFDVPLSREEKPEAYPDGPICVHEPYIDLYLEPTAEQARQYDVVMNVAVEVRNPFDTQSKSQLPEPEVRIDGGGGIQYAPKREKSSQPEETQQPSSPSTPKATPSGDEPSPQPDRQPEYIHIQWEHNSDIVPDLFGLVKQIDEKVMDQKKVLIHCQCGVSRSASLVVAYWLYKNPSLSVQEAYDAVKGKSKWIGPNMNFIMQLQEFRSSLARGGQLADDRGLSPITPRSALSDWPGPFSARSSDTGPRSSGLSPGSYGFNRPVPDKDSLPALSPGPSSAPSGMPWPKDHNETTNRPRALSSTTTPPTYVDPAGHVIPSVNIVEPERSEIKTKTITVPTFPHKEDDSATPKEPLESPRSTEFAMAPLNPSSEADPADAFGLMSPTSTEFSSSPFDRSALLAQLGMGSMHQHDERPARSQSLRSRQPQNTFSENAQSLGTPANRTLRGKVSSPSMREQQELQRLQADIEAKLHLEQKQQQQQQSQQQNWQQPNVSETSFAGLDEALMSPRATEFTENPFAMALSPPSQASAAPDEAHDPRSPAHKGVSPITRNIGDVL